MKKRQIINIVNFIRGNDSRTQDDLVEPVKEQIKLIEKYNLKGTFLVQYDAMYDSKYYDVLCKLNKNQFEIGIWFEIVQPLVEKAGLIWRGQYPWDWHSYCDLSAGYTLREREKLVDVFF